MAIVRFLDIGAKFLDADGKIPATVMPDQLHLSPAGYRIWAEAIMPTLERISK
jgi:lysophospholipase L1-like esterase